MKDERFRAKARATAAESIGVGNGASGQRLAALRQDLLDMAGALAPGLYAELSAHLEDAAAGVRLLPFAEQSVGRCGRVPATSGKPHTVRVPELHGAFATQDDAHRHLVQDGGHEDSDNRTLLFEVLPGTEGDYSGARDVSIVTRAPARGDVLFADETVLEFVSRADGTGPRGERYEYVVLRKMDPARTDSRLLDQTVTPGSVPELTVRSCRKRLCGQAGVVVRGFSAGTRGLVAGNVLC